MVEAFEECLTDAGIERNQIEAAWFGAGIDAFNVGSSAMPMSIALRLNYIRLRKWRICARPALRHLEERYMRLPPVLVISRWHLVLKS